MEAKNLKLKNQMKDKERVINDLMNLNVELQNKVIEEYPKLIQINEEIQTKVLSNFNELMCKSSRWTKMLSSMYIRSIFSIYFSSN